MPRRGLIALVGALSFKAVMLALASINRLASTALLTGGITPA